MSKECPMCNQNTLVTIYGNMWDWDLDLCHNMDCNYEMELDVMTCYEEDGTLTVLQKPIDEDKDGDRLDIYSDTIVSANNE